MVKLGFAEKRLMFGMSVVLVLLMELCCNDVEGSTTLNYEHL